jgi:hypothetical protein
MKLFLAALLMSVPVWGWHPVGHKIVAAICYDQLPGKTRARVDELMRRHPDYAAFTTGVRGDKARWAFINAAAWADDIKGDARFYDDTRRDAVATQLLPGYPDMKRHTNWHFINFYFSPDGTAFPATPTPNVLTQMPVVLGGLGGGYAPYYLGWFLHLGGDLHQPMHNVSRYTAWNVDRNGRPQSDLGGNNVNVDGYTNLHAVWDDLLGTTDDEDYIDWMAKRLRREQKEERPAVTDVDQWSKEGFELAKSEAYRFAAELGPNDKPFRRTPDYTRNALAVARKRAALAGRRMAALLAEKLP